MAQKKDFGQESLINNGCWVTFFLFLAALIGVCWFFWDNWSAQIARAQAGRKAADASCAKARGEWIDVRSKPYSRICIVDGKTIAGYY